MRSGFCGGCVYRVWRYLLSGMSTPSRNLLLPSCSLAMKMEAAHWPDKNVPTAVYTASFQTCQCFSRNSGHANYPTTRTWFVQSERVYCRSVTFVVGWAIQDVSNVLSVVVFEGHVPFLLEVGGNTILRNVGCHSPNDTMSGLRRLESAQRWHLNLAAS